MGKFFSSPGDDVLTEAERRIGGGESMSQVARSLGIHKGSLSRWLKDRQQAAPPPEADPQSVKPLTDSAATIPVSPAKREASRDVSTGTVTTAPGQAAIVTTPGKPGSAAVSGESAPLLDVPDELYLELLDVPPRMYGIVLAAKYGRAPLIVPPLTPGQKEMLRPLVPLLRQLIPATKAAVIIMALAIYGGSLAERFAVVNEHYRRQYGPLPEKPKPDDAATKSSADAAPAK